MANKNEAKIKFTAETGEFNDQIKQSNNEMAQLRAELKLNAAQMKTNGVSVEGLEKKHKILSDQLKASQEKTEALSEKAKKAAEIFGENSDEAQKLRVQVLNAQTAEEKLTQEINACNRELEEQKAAAGEAGDALDNAGDDAEKLDKNLDKAGDSAEGMSGKAKAAAAGLAALGAAAIAAGKECIDAFNEVDEGADNVIKATGATGEAAESLENSYQNIAKSVVADFGDIGSTLGEVNTRFGFMGKEAEDASTLFLKFAEVTGMDATTAVQDVSRAIESAGLNSSEYRNILDSLTKAGQVTGVSVDTLAGLLTDNGAVMRSMGYDTQDTIAMLAQFEKAGVNSSTVTKGMQKALADWSKDGLNAKDEFAKMVEGIKNGSVSAGEAYEVFGNKAGVELVDAIKSGRFEYDTMLATISNSKGALETTFDGTVDGGYQLDLTMQNCKMAMAEAGETLATALTPALTVLCQDIIPSLVNGFAAAVGWMKEHKGAVIAIATVIGILTTAITAYNVVKAVKAAMDKKEVTTLGALIAAHWAQATAAMAAIAPYVLAVAAIAAVIAIIVLLIKYWDEVVAACAAAWEWIKSILSQAGNWIYVNVIQPIANFFTGLWNGIVSVFTTCWNSIVGFFTTLGSWIYNNVIAPIANFFTGLWNGIVSAWHTVIDPWIEIVKRLSVMFYNNVILPIKNFFVGLWNSITSGLQAAWNWCVSLVSTVAGWINANVIQPIARFFTGLWNAIKNGVMTAVNAVKSVFSTVSGWINSNVVQPVTGFFSKLWNGFTNGAKKAWEGVKSVFSKVGSFFGSIFSVVKDKILAAFAVGGRIFAGIKDGILSVFKTVVNGIIRGLNTVIALPFKGLNGILNTLHGLSIVGVQPFSWLTWRAPVPKIPLLAEGGILTSPTLNIAGEAGPEAVIPIDKLQTYIAGAVERSMQNANLAALATAIENLANRPIELDINGRQFALATAGDSDRVNGLRNRFNERGLLLD